MSTHDDAVKRMEKSIAALKDEFSSIRTGRASASLFDKVRVDYYGEATPLSQVANVAIPEARLVVITPWAKGIIGEIEKAIQKANLGLNPANDGTVIRISIPPLTADLRKELAKQAKATAETSRVAYEGFNGRDGACVIYNYETGEVICSVSTKAYDPQAPPTITKENEDEYEGVYLDNVLSSSYIPGSIFKIVTAAAAYENIPDIESRTFYCEQEKEIGGSDVTCMEYHGEMTFKEAMACSCNIVFADLAVELGQDKMTQTANKMGINSSFNISGVNTAKGRYDVSKANTNQLAWSGVGQYNDLVNPMQMAVICGSIANGGKTKMPYIMDDATSFLSDMGIPLPGKMSDELVSPQTAEKLKEIMRYTISDYYGDSMFGGLTVCAKTGTGETGEGKEPNAWMVGFSIDEDCPLAFAVVVEHGGIGYSNAGPIASSALIQAAKSLGSKAVG